MKSTRRAQGSDGDRKPRGRPRGGQKLEKLIAYLPPGALAATKRAARAAGARSLSAWASAVLEREARRTLRTGLVPLDLLDLPSPVDPTGAVRRAVRDERDAGA
jgi:hypothetical protein